MIVLGIDPGYATVGYGVIEHSRGVSRMLTYGVITTRPGPSLPARLGEIFSDMQELIGRFRPGAVAIEQLFFNTNQKTAIQVAQARGVLLLACVQAGMVPFEYTPLQVKQAIAGYGRADKHQMMEMTRTILKLEKVPKPDDAADALAIAICHAYSAESLAFDK